MSRMLAFLGATNVIGDAPHCLTFDRPACIRVMDAYLRRSGLPLPDAAQLHRTAAMHHLQAERYRKARRHLRALARLTPLCANTHYHLGQAYESDPYGCDRRAARSYKKAAKLNANEPKYRAALGRALVRINDVRSGVKVLCKAANAAPTDTEVMEVVVDGLREAGEAGVAFDLLSKALFLAPANRELRRLWDRTKFDMALERQKTLEESTQHRQPLTVAKVIPFIRVADPDRVTGNNNRRHDAGSQPSPHFMKLRAFRGGKPAAEQS